MSSQADLFSADPAQQPPLMGGMLADWACPDGGCLDGGCLDGQFWEFLPILPGLEPEPQPWIEGFSDAAGEGGVSDGLVEPVAWWLEPQAEPTDADADPLAEPWLWTATCEPPPPEMWVEPMLTTAAVDDPIAVVEEGGVVILSDNAGQEPGAQDATSGALDPAISEIGPQPDGFIPWEWELSEITLFNTPDTPWLAPEACATGGLAEAEPPADDATAAPPDLLVWRGEPLPTWRTLAQAPDSEAESAPEFQSAPGPLPLAFSLPPSPLTADPLLPLIAVPLTSEAPVAAALAPASASPRPAAADPAAQSPEPGSVPLPLAQSSPAEPLPRPLLLAALSAAPATTPPPASGGSSAVPGPLPSPQASAAAPGALLSALSEGGGGGELTAQGPLQAELGSEAVGLAELLDQLLGLPRGL